jgi:hypothetical protein
MKKFLLTSACVIAIATIASAAEAQQGSMMMNQSGQGMMAGQGNNQSQPMPGYGVGRRGNMPRGYGHMRPGMMGGQGWGYGNMGPGMMGRGMMGGGMMGSGMMGSGMMGSGMMGSGMMGSGMGPQMMIIMMDTNNDGKLSLEEFQAIHGRMFKYLDKNGDGQLSPDEFQNRWRDDDDEDEGSEAQ